MNKSEDQITEFKESWRDEHLKTICAFANTNGGKLCIGIDDQGKIKDISNLPRLLEDIPSKIKTLLGITPEVHVKNSKGKKYLVINVKTSDSSISLKGKFYARSGSTTQELNGPELQKFLLTKSNISWESLPEKNATLEDINNETVDFFKSRANDKQLPASKEKGLGQLLHKLHLRTNGKLLRAGILLFSKDPQRFHASAYTKIGKFSSEEVLLSSDDIRGNLFEQAERTMEILKNKYLSSEIRIEGLYRNEDLEYPESALREAIINAIAHKDYSGPCILIKVYADKLVFWNPGELPKDLTIESLKRNHPSFPRNKLIAEIFFHSGLIEAWGSGTMKMIKDCVRAGLPEPVFEEKDGGILVTFSKDIYTEAYFQKKGLNERQVLIVKHLKTNATINNAKYQELTATAKRTATRDLTELLEKNVIVKTGTTGKGTSYRLKGQKVTSENTDSKKNGENSDLDKKLYLLDKELEIFDPEDEIKRQFNTDLLIEIFDTWFSDLLKEVIPVIQKFNRYFVDPGHFVNLPNGVGWVRFSNEDSKQLIENLKAQLAKNRESLDRNRVNVTANISTNYGSFRKAGLDTFGANYSIEIKFELNWYEVLMDDEVMKRNQRQQFQRQYHKPITKNEAVELANKLGDLIYQHINERITKIKETKSKGATKGPKET